MALPVGRWRMGDSDAAQMGREVGGKGHVLRLCGPADRLVVLGRAKSRVDIDRSLPPIAQGLDLDHVIEKPLGRLKAREDFGPGEIGYIVAYDHRRIKSRATRQDHPVRSEGKGRIRFKYSFRNPRKQAATPTIVYCLH